MPNCPYENNTFQTGHMRIKKERFCFVNFSNLDMSEESTVRTKLQHSPTHINFTRVRRNFCSKHGTSEMLKICCLHNLIIQGQKVSGNGVFFLHVASDPAHPGPLAPLRIRICVTYKKFLIPFLLLNTWCMKLIKHLFPHENTTA